MACSRVTLPLTLPLQEVRWDKGGTGRAGDYNFSMEKETKIISWEQDFLQRRLISAVKRVEIVGDRVLHIILRGRWCNVIVLNVRAPNEKKRDDSKGSFMRNKNRVFFLSFY